MSDDAAGIPVTPNPTSHLLLPVPAIICLAIGGYVVLVVIILTIRSCLIHRGICSEACGCCGKEKELACCSCCVSCSESCDCCKAPSVHGCLDAICPARKQYDCADVIMCQCCSDPESCCSCCASNEPLCNCGDCCDCNCNCQPPECETINCCCFEISLKGQQGGYPGPHGGYTNQGYPPQGGSYPGAGWGGAYPQGGGSGYPQGGGYGYPQPGGGNTSMFQAGGGPGVARPAGSTGWASSSGRPY